MSDERIERILKNTKFSMEMEGFTIDKEQEEIGRKILTGELPLADYIESVKQKYQRYSHEV
ncbi:MAG: antitoxin VbhA family protein [Oscillospiraceae bacterium]|nr:antitoxin VbhA family protein [Oscillospiraceae bacterium]